MAFKPENLVSVIICNYNYERYLVEAINSVLDQTYKNIQVIVVDDGSTDCSRQILESFDDSRLQVIYQANSGQASAFNTAFKNCTGEFIAFLDSDDFWYKRKLEVSIPAFDAGNVSVVQHNLQIVNDVSESSGDITPDIAPGRNTIQNSYFKKNHTGFFSPTSGVICRKVDLDKVFPLDVGWEICADVAFTRPLPIFGDIVMLDKILGSYRIHGGNNWADSHQSKKWIENQHRCVDYTNDWLARYGYHERIVLEKAYRYLRHRAECGLPIPCWMKVNLYLRKLVISAPGTKWLHRVLRVNKLVNYE